MRHVQITHTYVLAVPEEEAKSTSFDAVVNRGVTVMEQFIRERSQTLFDLRSHWEMMPREYSARLEVPTPPPASPPVVREPGQVSFTQDVLGDDADIGHPWDQGVFIFPEDHPYAAAERAAYDRYKAATGPSQQELKEEFRKDVMKALPSGPDDTDAWRTKEDDTVTED